MVKVYHLPCRFWRQGGTPQVGHNGNIFSRKSFWVFFKFSSTSVIPLIMTRKFQILPFNSMQKDEWCPHVFPEKKSYKGKEDGDRVKTSSNESISYSFGSLDSFVCLADKKSILSTTESSNYRFSKSLCVVLPTWVHRFPGLSYHDF